ncbi:MAG: hypothetical protein HQL70_09680 [Magnetococcales bacterium]|nr:hypothetical protein [Magnetococcales bacterium]
MSYYLTLDTAPTVTPVTLAEAKAHLRVDSAVEDEPITTSILAATGYIDGEDGWLGRSIVTQVWKMMLPGFGSVIRLPLPPIQSVDSIKYVDLDGASQTLATDQYALTDREVRPAYNVSWPSTRVQPDAVTVTFTAGYGLAEDVPAAIKAAILLHIGSLYQVRESHVIGDVIEPPFGYSALLASYRVWGER